MRRARPYPTKQAWQKAAQEYTQWEAANILCPKCRLNPLETKDGDAGKCVACNRWFFMTCQGYWQEAT